MELKPQNVRKTLSNALGFTLLELLVVMAILAILASLIVATSSYVNNRAALGEIQTMVIGMATALEDYAADRGAYPAPAGDLPDNGRYALYQAITGDGNNKIETANNADASTGEVGSSGTVYYSALKESDLQNVGGWVVIDAYGNPFEYVHPAFPPAGYPVRNNNSFDLFSVGRDGALNTPATHVGNFPNGGQE